MRPPIGRQLGRLSAPLTSQASAENESSIPATATRSPPCALHRSFFNGPPTPLLSLSALLIFSRNLFFGPLLHPRVFRELVSLIGGKEDSRSCEIVSSRLRVLLRTLPVLLSSLPLSSSSGWIFPAASNVFCCFAARSARPEHVV